MKYNQAKAFLPIIQAAAEGKIIQGFNTSRPSRWEDYKPDEEMILKNPENYRIKPEPKLRAWKPEEVPVGALIRGRLQHKYKFLIVGNSDAGIKLGSGTDSWDAKELLNSDYEHSVDNGKTFAPCGILE